MHHALSASEMESLMEELFACDEPFACPARAPDRAQDGRPRPRAALREELSGWRGRSKHAPDCRRRRSSFEERLGHRFRDRDATRGALGPPLRGQRAQAGGQLRAPRVPRRRRARPDRRRLALPQHPDLPEGELSRRKSALVSRRRAGALRARARPRRASPAGPGRGAQRRPRQGLAARRLVRSGDRRRLPRRRHARGDQGSRAVPPRLERRASTSPPPTPRATCRSACKPAAESAPVYRVSEESGPDHDKRFTVEVLIDGEVAGRGTGRSKKAAELDAARQVLEVTTLARPPTSGAEGARKRR